MRYLNALILICLNLIFFQTSHAQNTQKTLHLPLATPITGLDPAKVSDRYSLMVSSNIFDSLLTYDYLARPETIIPNTVEALPTISNQGKTYTFKIKPGIYFSPDPVFKNKKRELVAADYVYSMKRHLDKTLRSPWSFLVNGIYQEADSLTETDSLTGDTKTPFDYDREIKGIKAIDKYTLELNLKETNFNLNQILAMPTFGAVAREVIEAYSENTNAHPVGTGPYQLASWKPGDRLVLRKNPNFRLEIFNFQPDPSNLISVQAAADMQGKKLPAIDQIELKIIEEEQPIWLAFLNRQLDYVGIPQVALTTALNIDPENPTHATLKAELKNKGMQLQRQRELGLTFTIFNMEDPVVGGYKRENIALRRAIALAYPQHETIANIRRGQAVPAQYIIPQGVAGHNPNFVAQTGYDPAKANALLDATGYKLGPDGYRTLPTGVPFSIEMASGNTALELQWDGYWQQAFDAIKIKLTFSRAKWSEHAKANREGQLQMWGLAWGADYPDGSNFMQLHYGPNTGDNNYAAFQNSEYDALYEQSLNLPHGPERQRLFDKMNQIVINYQPWVFGETRLSNVLSYDYVKGLVINPLLQAPWRYIDIDKPK